MEYQAVYCYTEKKSLEDYHAIKILPILSVQSHFSEITSCLICYIIQLHLTNLAAIFLSHFLYWVSCLEIQSNLQTSLKNIPITRNCDYLYQIMPCVSKVSMCNCHMWLLQYQVLDNSNWIISNIIALLLSTYTHVWGKYLINELN